MDNDNKISMLQIFANYLRYTHPIQMLFHLFFITILVAVMTVSYVTIFNWNSLVSLYEEAHNVRDFSDNLKVSVAADDEIAQQLDRAMDNLDGSRAYVYRFHNGLAAINNVPFFFQTMTHEAISPGANRIMPYEQRIPVGIGMRMNVAFLRNDCIVVQNTDKDPSNPNYYYWESRGARNFIRCPIFMKNNDLFGFVGIDFFGDIKDVQLATKAVKDVANEVARIYASSR